jgi:hypothetical protein
MAKAVACPDCDSEVSFVRLAKRVYRAEVQHDDSCPWLSAFERDGGLGVRTWRRVQ